MNSDYDLSKHKQRQEKMLQRMRMQGLPVDQLRTVLDHLYDGVPGTALWLTKIRSFYSKKQNLHREHAVYLWLARNGLRGQKLVDFFEGEGGFLQAMNLLINRMDGRKYSLETIKIDEAL